MARDIQKRLQQLRTRRAGTDRLMAFDSAYADSVIAKSFVTEGWQKRASQAPNTRYALGAMEAVDADYTRISLETADRVGRQLETGLAASGISVEFRLQGSVPLNLHIRGVSDVDLLNLSTTFCTYDKSGSRSWSYTNPTARTSLEELTGLRSASEKVLKAKYPAANVDCSGSKAIKIFGGSLQRPVDVVPSHWYDTARYQETCQQHDRTVRLLDKKTNRTIDSKPFMHILLVDYQDSKAAGGLRKAIRLCKNVKSDAQEDGKTIGMSSFDIAATMYHADMAALSTNTLYELSVLAETQRFLDYLFHNKTKAMELMTPDGSRPIFDSESKFSGLTSLSIEFDDLIKEVAIEQNPRLGSSPSLADCRAVLQMTRISGF